MPNLTKHPPGGFFVTKTARLGPALLAAVALISAVAPIATDMYLPAFPQVADELNAAASPVQLTLAAFMVGMAGGQLFWGPVSDRLGRYRPLLLAMALFIVAGAVAALSVNIWMLVAARAAQGFAGSAGQVIGRALTRDLASGHRLARAYSLLAVVAGIAPVVAPVFGGVLVGLLGWRGILWAITAFAVVLLVTVLVAVPETLPPTKRAPAGSGHLGHTVREVVVDRLFVGSTLIQAFGFGAIFAFISGSSFVLQNQYGLSSTAYSAAFAANACAMIAGGALNGGLVVRVGENRLLRLAVAGIATSTVLLALVALVGSRPPLWLVLPLVMVGSLCGSPIMANTSVLALSRHHGSSAGTAAAILGAAQSAFAGVVSPLASIGGEASVRSMALVMAVCALVAAVCHAGLLRGAEPTAAGTEERARRRGGGRRGHLTVAGRSRPE